METDEFFNPRDAARQQQAQRLNPEFCTAAIGQRGLLQLPLSPKDHSTC